MKGWVRFLVGAAALIGLLFLGRATIFRPKLVEVEAARVTRGLVEDAVTNSQAGTVRSRLKARVGPDRAGRIVEIPRREGAAVTRGEALIRLDATTATTQLALADKDLTAQQAAVAAARAAAVLARQEFERTDRLMREGSVSQGTMDQAKSRLDSAEAQLDASEAQVERARAAVRLAREELDHLVVTAPFDGVVTQRFVEVGESVIPGQPSLELQSPDSLYVSAPIDEIDIARLRDGLPARVSLDPFPGVSWAGRVSRVAPYVNDFKEQNRTLEIEVDLAPAPDRPRPLPGTSADVEIILDEHRDVLRVPTFAVIELKKVLLAQGGRAVSRDVTTGLRNWEWTEIVTGLAEGDGVITNLDKQGIVAGARITVTEAAPEKGRK